jgi:hypothetical protein
VLYALEMLEVMRRVLLCMLEAVEGGFCLLEMLEVSPPAPLAPLMRCVLCLPEVLDVLEVLEVPEVMRCVPLWMSEAVEARLYLLDAL